MAFHSLHFNVPTKVATKKKTWTPTILDSQDAFLQEVQNSNSIVAKMKGQKALSDIRGIPDHPIIFEVANSETIDYFVCVCNTTYDCASLIEAVDVTFKFYVLFNLPFPPQCINFWLFLNQIFYKINLPQEAKAKMISVLNSFQL